MGGEGGGGEGERVNRDEINKPRGKGSKRGNGFAQLSSGGTRTRRGRGRGGGGSTAVWGWAHTCGTHTLVVV